MDISGTVLRVQCADGRGPYRPGFSHHWCDPDGSEEQTPPWWMEIGEDIATAHARMIGPYHWGCGFRSHAQFANWFSESECRRLDRLGYSLVTICPDIIIADTPTQVVFGCTLPLTNIVQRYKLSSRLVRAA